MRIVRVVLEKNVVYEVIASITDFANWVNGIPKGDVLMINDFQSWVRYKDNSLIYINRLAVMAAYGKEVGE